MNQLEKVEQYYGEILKTKADLQTTACCSAEALSPLVREALLKIEDEVQDRFYGCGAPFPEALEGLRVLDLGCGTGRDAYLLSQLVGQSGHVTGIDMTDEQLAVANKHLNTHMKTFGYSTPNVTFKKGFIEDLEGAGIQNESMDLIVSNCVVNLSPDKERVFKEAFRVLRPGGELYFSDVFCDRRLPESCREDSVLLGECLGGALYVEDFRRLLSSVGCKDYRLMSSSEIQITNPEIKHKVAGARFYSLTIRAFKLPFEDRCEDYGQVAYYKGSLTEAPTLFTLDNHHVFEKGRPLPICQNTARMLTETRFADHFEVTGDTSTHFGLFDCAPLSNTTTDSPSSCC